ncbi:MAG: hypothetical protein HY840_02160 [Bacteroidetes bacterium]|nr:hypothetical protein [Bacteroidota bacterium]
MTLDYLDKVNGYGDCIVRLFDFDSLQAEKFRQAIQHTIIQNKKQLDLATLNFVEGINCTLTLRISDNDIGIISADNKMFFCDLSIGTYSQMTILLEPFCNKKSRGHQWLYDIDTLVDLLFSPTGTWQ